MITENTDKGGIGKVMGMSTSIIMIGTVSGPMLGGVLLGWFGYWAAWSVPVALLFLDMIVQLVVRQPEAISPDMPSKESGPDTDPTSDPYRDVEEIPTEASPLLAPSPRRPPSTPTTEVDSDAKTKPASDSESNAELRNFYTVMLRDFGVWISIFNTIVQAAIRAGFNATLPVYLRDKFNLGPSSVGATFFLLQVPVVFLSPLLGWVRDRVGVRYPTTIGWTLLCPLLCCLGIPGSGRFWPDGSEKSKEIVFFVCISGVGLVFPFVQGAGALHMRSKLHSSCSTRRPMLTTDCDLANRGGWDNGKRDTQYIWS